MMQRVEAAQLCPTHLAHQVDEVRDKHHQRHQAVHLLLPRDGKAEADHALEAALGAVCRDVQRAEVLERAVAGCGAEDLLHLRGGVGGGKYEGSRVVKVLLKPQLIPKTSKLFGTEWNWPKEATNMTYLGRNC